MNPQLQDQNLPCCRLHHPRMGAVSTPTRPPQRRTHCSESRYELLDLVMPIEPVVAEDPSRRDPDRLGAESPPLTCPRDRARARGGRRRLPPHVVRDVFDACRMVRIGDEHDAREVALLQEMRGRGEGLPRRPSGRLSRDRALGDLMIVEIARTDAGFREAVARLPAARHHDDGCYPAAVQVDGVVESRREDTTTKSASATRHEILKKRLTAGRVQPADARESTRGRAGRSSRRAAAPGFDPRSPCTRCA